MGIRIAIPEPTSCDGAYNQRSLPQYVAALEAAGATAVVVPLLEAQDKVAKCIAEAQGVLLPGSGFDVDPERYGEARQPECGPADAARTAVDELLLQDAFNLRKPILAICHGVQILATAGLARGKRVTCYEHVRVEAEMAGGIFAMYRPLKNLARLHNTIEQARALNAAASGP